MVLAMRDLASAANVEAALGAGMRLYLVLSQRVLPLEIPSSLSP